MLNRQRGYLGPGVQFARHAKSLLLGYPAVEEEIKLSPAQKSRLKEIDDELRRSVERATKEARDRMEAYKKNRQANGQQYEPDVLSALGQEDAAARGPVIAGAEAARVKALDRRQRARLDQIQLQAEGPTALTRPEIQERLNMSPEQSEAIGAIVAQGREELVRVSALPPELMPYAMLPAQRAAVTKSKEYKSAVEKSRAAALKARGATMQMIAKVLTRKQRETYQKMLGEPFDLAKLRADRSPTMSEPKPEPKAP
jgi:hypothetical protein